MEYITLSEAAETTFTEKRSVFIGNAGPVKSVEEAMAFVSAIRGKYGDATHNTYAYMLSDGTARYSDDGEPQGTAGIPILSVIQKGGFTDAAIVVTRYFGGILLGAGGLVRAYGAAARDAVKAARVVTYSQYTEFRIVCSYSDYQRLIPLREQLAVKEDGSEFSDKVTLFWAVKEESYRYLCDKINELCGARVSVEMTGTRYSA